MVVSLSVCIVVVCFFKEGFLEIPSHTTFFWEYVCRKFALQQCLCKCVCLSDSNLSGDYRV